MTEEKEAAREGLRRLRTEVGKAVIGQDPAVTGVLIGLLCRGHVLVEGVPGVAKTLLVRTLAAALDLRTTRIQFTADLMPGDVTGSLIYDTSTGRFEFREGPVFTNLLLADEINRTPPKTQSSLLEAMEERQVSVDGTPRPLPDPFCVIATQNPVEYEGTYPLPEAQLDRFLVKLSMPLPPREDEMRVLAAHSAGFDPSQGGNLRGMEYLFGFDPGRYDRHERFFVNELPRWAEEELGVSDERDQRIVFGCSDGGAHALAVGVSHADRFGHVIAYSSGMPPQGRERWADGTAPFIQLCAGI
ncbi:MAG: MoxR-like ATPase, partial [Pseudonocardiales bacterium]|nr:MoxR-like ATPase [Pseudonocardiales bacterium]